MTPQEKEKLEFLVQNFDHLGVYLILYGLASYLWGIAMLIMPHHESVAIVLVLCIPVIIIGGNIFLGWYRRGKYGNIKSKPSETTKRWTEWSGTLIMGFYLIFSLFGLGKDSFWGQFDLGALLIILLIIRIIARSWKYRWYLLFPILVAVIYLIRSFFHPEISLLEENWFIFLLGSMLLIGGIYEELSLIETLHPVQDLKGSVV